MLYSESKERENQFITALKIGFPFFLLALLLFYIFRVSKDNLQNLLLSIILIPIYVYYIFYLIHYGFRSTLIDPITKTFTRNEILLKIKKSKKNKIVILLRVENIFDINQRYGIKIADSILESFCYKINDFFTNYNFKNIPIGRYGGSNFLLIVDGKTKELTHLLTIFSKELKNKGIDDIEVKVDFSLIESNYDTKIENIIKKLFLDIDEKKESNSFLPNIKPDEFEKIIMEAINSEKFIFKFQPSYNKNNEIVILEVLTKIYSKSYGMLSYPQIERVINHLGYEMIFYKKMILALLKELKNKNINNIYFSIKISPVILRNNQFMVYLSQLLYKNEINSSLFILEFSEEKKYEEIYRFKEILTQYKKSGFLISVDNFGGNNCSLDYIKYLPLDIIKFDIEFTKNIEEKKYMEILKSYMQLVKKLNVKSMVKFVDKEATYEIIKTLNPDFIQGFIVSKPKSLKQILHVIKEKNEIR